MNWSPEATCDLNVEPLVMCGTQHAMTLSSPGSVHGITKWVSLRVELQIGAMIHKLRGRCNCVWDYKVVAGLYLVFHAVGTCLKKFSNLATPRFLVCSSRRSGRLKVQLPIGCL